MLKEKGQNLRDLVEAYGPEAVHRKIKALLWEEKPKLKPEDFSFREIWEALQGLEEQVAATAFPVITGELINKKVIDAYLAVETIGDRLVTIVPSKHRTERIPGFEALETVKEVAEGMPYEEVGMIEKYVDINSKKFGEIISITEEAIMEEQTGQILARAARIGEAARFMREKIILDVVQDVNSTSYSNAVLYHDATYGNLGTTAFGTDGSGLEATRLKLTAMKDEAGRRILVSKRQLLVPDALLKAASDLVFPGTLPGTAVSVESPFFKRVITELLSSPLLDDNSITAYYYGDFRRQFWYMAVWPIQVFRQKQDSDAAFERDVYARFKVRLYGGAGAVDHRSVIKGIV